VAAVADLLEVWRKTVDDGVDGVTISGGEPMQQPEALRELLLGMDEIRDAAAGKPDILVYTGYEKSELTDVQRGAAELADVLITGRFDAAQPTGLLWRGSANQRMIIQTELGRRRYAGYVDKAPDRPSLQVLADGDGVWLIGTPQRGTLPELERDLRRQDLDIEGVSWRP
jgi:anaerobic ribonucleoside-triphosphate reductase activating protein